MSVKTSMHGEAVLAEADKAGVIYFGIRHKWEWGSIYVRPVSGGAEVTCNSSFGVYGFCWSAMGEDWREFLSDLDFDYAMQKMAGSRFRVPLDRDEFVAAMTEELAKTESDLREWKAFDDDLVEQFKVCREALEDLSEDVHPASLFAEWNRCAQGHPYSMELYQCRLDKPCPQARGFWDNIWVPFMAHLRGTPA